MVSAVEAAATLPIFLFALLAGAVADIVDRRQLLIWVNVAMSATAGGGYRWSLMRDAATPGVFVETWWEASWVDHQRQHMRVRRQDQALPEEIAAVLRDGSSPGVRRFLAAK